MTESGPCSLDPDSDTACVTALLRSVVTGDCDGIARGLSQVFPPPSALSTLALLAAANGQLEVLALLLSAGADATVDGRRALQLAAACGWPSIVERLNSEPAFDDEIHRRLVLAAARYGQVEVLDLLHRKGHDLSRCADIVEEFASQRPRLPVVRFLADIGAVPGGPHLANLLRAIGSRRTSRVRRAIPGSDFVKHGHLILETAARSGSAPILRLLHTSGAVLDDEDARILCAAAESGNAEAFRYVLEKTGGQPDRLARAIAVSAARGDPRMTRALYELGAPLNEIEPDTLSNAAFDEQYELFDYLVDIGKLDGIAGERASIEEMQQEIRSALEVYHPSKLWEFFNEINLEQLRRFGIRRFKRCVNQNYFNYVPLGLGDPQLRGLLRDWLRRPSARQLIAGAANPDRYPRSGRKVWRDRRVFQLWDQSRLRDAAQWFQRRLYVVLVGMLWHYMERNDALELHRDVAEPTLGAPIECWYGETLVSQDLAHSILECNSILAGLDASDDGPTLRIAEIGPGYGRVGDLLLSTRRCRYFVFDIPPSLFVAQWYLTCRHPFKRAFRFRPFERFEDVREELEQSEIGFFTSNQIALFPEGYFDVGVNISSLHEMRPEQMRHLLGELYRISGARVYIKQYRHYVNPWDGIEVTEDSYFLAEGWRRLAWRTDPIDERFFEGLLVREALPVRAAPTPAASPYRPTISVLLANYNDAPYLETSLRAIAVQTDPPDEIVIIDDGSTDDSVEVVQRILGDHPNLKLLRHARNRGQHAAIQRAMLHATGDYVVWAASDDLLLPRFIERSRAVLARFPGVGLCFSRLCAWGDGSRKITEFTEISHGAAFDLGTNVRNYTPEALKLILRKHYLWISGNTVLARRDVLLEAGGFDDALRWHADWFSYYAVALRHGAASIPETLAMMRERQDTYSRTGISAQVEQRRVLRAILDSIKRPRNRDLLRTFRRCPSLLSPFGKQIVVANLFRPQHWDIVLPVLAWQIPRKLRASLGPAVGRGKGHLFHAASRLRAASRFWGRDRHD